MPVNMWGNGGTTYRSYAGRSYTADPGGFISNVVDGDALDLFSAGCTFVSVGGVIGRLIGANMNSTADQLIYLNIPTGARYGLTKIWACNASISLTTANGGIYTAAAKGGTALVAAAAWSGFTASTIYATAPGDVVTAQKALVQTANPLYLTLTTAQGAAATIDIFVFGDLIG